MASLRFIVSGGGTGGHIFPAISIANALKKKRPDAEILFVGAEGRMEMEKVPAAGYEIKGLPVAGFNRSNLWKNFEVLKKLFRSIKMAKEIVKEFRPDVAIGVGGYASGPTLFAANRLGIPTLLQEQNSYAGVTNKLLAKNAHKICVAYEGMERFFPKEKIILTGNPVRQNLASGTKSEAIKYFNEEFGVNFTAECKTLLIIGGSLGAGTINQSIIAHLPELTNSGVQVIWQTGKNYYSDCKAALSRVDCPSSNIICTDFVSQMPLAYALSDLVISRAGASSISELCLLGKPSILVPSPNVAEDHQTHNALALVRKDAAILVKDVDAKDQLISRALALIQDDARLQNLHDNVLTLALPNSARIIAEEVMKLARR